METFFLRNENEIFILVKYILIGVFVLLFLNILKEIIRILLNNKEDYQDNKNYNQKNGSSREEQFLQSPFGSKNVPIKLFMEEEEERLKEVEEEVVETKGQLEFDFNDVCTEIPNDKEEEKETPKIQSIFNLEEKEKPIKDTNYYEEYYKKEKERLEDIAKQPTFSYYDFYTMFYSMYYYGRNNKIEIPIQKGYFDIKRLCDVKMENLDDRTKYAICKGVRKTKEKIKLIKKDLKTNEILLEHEFDVYETSKKHIYKKFIVFHSISDGYRRIRFFEKKKEGYKNVEIDDKGKPYVLTINKNSFGCIHIIRNHKDYEKYAEKIEEIN